MIIFYPFILTMASAHILTPSYESGKELAGDGKEQVSQEMESREIKGFIRDVKGRGRNPRKGDLGTPMDSPVSSFLLDVYGERQHFELNPQKDPMFQQASPAMKRADGQLGVQNDQAYTVHKCREEKLQAVVECEIHKDVSIHRRMAPVTKYDSYEFYGPNEGGIFRFEKRGKDSVRYWTDDKKAIKAFLHQKRGVDPNIITSLHTELKGANSSTVHNAADYKGYGFKPWGKRDWFFHSYKVTYGYQDEEEEKYPEVLTINGCEAVESLADQGYYKLHSKQCLDSQNPRIYEDLPISQECWREHRVYHAIKKAIGDCQDLRDRGCEQMESRHTQGVYEQTYRCKQDEPATERIVSRGERPFCLTGDCEDMLDFDDMDFDQALAQMALVNELGKYAGKPRIFSGKSHSCKDTKFKHCCFKSSGIAVRTGISKCSSGERELSKNRGKGLCVYVGSKTIKKARIKIGKKKVYCCFPSKLLRVFQQQGRNQLRMGWGSAKHPKCNGLTIEQIQRIDFGLMDLSEAFDEIQQLISEINVPRAQAQLKQRLRHMKGAIQ